MEHVGYDDLVKHDSCASMWWAHEMCLDTLISLSWIGFGFSMHQNYEFGSRLFDWYGNSGKEQQQQ